MCNCTLRFFGFMSFRRDRQLKKARNMQLHIGHVQLHIACFFSVDDRDGNSWSQTTAMCNCTCPMCNCLQLYMAVFWLHEFPSRSSTEKTRNVQLQAIAHALCAIASNCALRVFSVDDRDGNSWSQTNRHLQLQAIAHMACAIACNCTWCFVWKQTRTVQL